MNIDTFKIEEWMNAYSPKAKYDLTSTCIKPFTLKEFLSLCGIKYASEITDIPMDYGEIHGSKRLKNAIKSLYENQDIDNITVTHGGIGANQLVYETLLEKGDHVITVLPTYQQHYSIPKALGARVTTVYLNENNHWRLNLHDIEKNITRKTKLISLNTPNNPTGAVMSDDELKALAGLAASYNIWILCDEAYRGLNFRRNPYSASMADIYSKGISTGSMSKTYSLAGLRLGWICAKENLINEINKHREYNTISISILDDYFASLALENKDIILKRNFQIMKSGFRIFEEWLNSEIYVKANLPQSGTTAILRYRKDIPSKKLCYDFQSKTGVALLPGETVDLEGTVRVGFCVGDETLKKGLDLFSEYLRTI